MMEWEQIEESWRDLKSRLMSHREGSDASFESLPMPRHRHARLMHLSREDHEAWRELEASVFAGDIDHLLRDFEASGGHH